jgi:hypothetical protein
LVNTDAIQLEQCASLMPTLTPLALVAPLVLLLLLLMVKMLDSL